MKTHARQDGKILCGAKSPKHIIDFVRFWNIHPHDRCTACEHSQIGKAEIARSWDAVGKEVGP